MIKLHQIDANTYSMFFNKIVKLYAEESVISGRWTNEEALEKASEETRNLLLDEEKTKDHYLFWIINDDVIIGYIWVGMIGSDKNEAFVFGLEIEENERGKGYGKDTMRLIEEVLKNKAISSIRLHVYDSSKIAVNLYNSIGFETVSRIMRKSIKS